MDDNFANRPRLNANRTINPNALSMNYGSNTPGMTAGLKRSLDFGGSENGNFNNRDSVASQNLNMNNTN